MPSRATSAKRVDSLAGAGGAGLLERVLDEALEGLAALADGAPLGARLDRVALLLEDEHVVAVLDHVGHPDAHERAQESSGGLVVRTISRARSSSGSMS